MQKTILSLAIAASLGAPGFNVQANTATTTPHVLLVSVDGLHQNDLDWFVRNNPNSALAHLINSGIEYTKARTPFPSDSFPGLVGQVTGGNPKTTGIYYDDAYSRSLLPPGTTDCANTAPGAEVQFAENLDKNLNRLDAGQNIPGLYANPPSSFSLISALSSHPAQDLIDPVNLPVDPATCMPVYPHQYLKVNTVFEVAHSRGLRTAWSDKHPAYEILSGPSGEGVDEFFTPEINSAVLDPTVPTPDFTKDNINTQIYDSLKVQAVINWIQGHDHAGNGNPGTPAIFGMNFQTVSTAQKLNTSNYYDQSNQVVNGLGGYTLDANGNPVPGPVLQGALQFVDQSIGAMINAADMSNTVVIISAKHGQSPENRNDLTIINDGDMIAALDAAWMARTGSPTGLVAHAMDDDGVLLWLNDHSQMAAMFAKNFLMNYSGTGVGSDAAGNKIAKPFSHAGLAEIYAGGEAAGFIGVPRTDDRVPDVIGIAKPGSVYSGSKLSKIAEHGGNAEQDRHVALVVAGAGIGHRVVTRQVETTQIAPTILDLLHLNPKMLQAVKAEGTQDLPGI